MDRLCFGNWKLNKSLEETESFIRQLNELVKEDEKDSFAVFPPALVSSLFSSQKRLSWGGQNVYFEESGAFTGENSASVLKSMGASYILVGHSERRGLFHETNEDVNKKVKLSLEKGLTPVVCIGETLEERDSEKVFDVLFDQINKGLSGVDLDSIVLAYEPVWAIGTGKTATPNEVEEVHAWLKDKLDASKTPLLYGGSVKPDNAKELFKIKDVNGFLIGGASLDPKTFYQIYTNMIL